MTPRRWAMIVATILWAAPSAQAQSTVAAEIIAIDPESRSELNARDPLYVHIAYRSDVPLRFRVNGYLNGSQVLESASMNPAPTYPAGEGEAIAWIAYGAPTRIDEVRILAADEKWNDLTGIRSRIDVSWSGVAGAQRTPAAWATQLSAEQQQRVRDTSERQSDDGGPVFIALFLFAGWSVPGYWIMQVYAWRRYRDTWRKWALLPLWITVPLLLYTLLALTVGSNLWPLAMIFVSPFVFVYLVGLAVARKYSADR